MTDRSSDALGRRSRIGSVLACALILGAYLVIAAVPAGAVVTCSYDSVNREVDVALSGAGDSALISVGAGGAILVNTV